VKLFLVLAKALLEQRAIHGSDNVRYFGQRNLFDLHTYVSEEKEGKMMALGNGFSQEACPARELIPWPSEYVVTDPVAVYAAECAVSAMKKGEPLSALLLDGPPGVGKTFLGKCLAKALGATRFLFQFFPGCGKEELLRDRSWDGQGMVAGLLPRAIEASQTGKAVLILNELDKADVSVDGFLLDFLQEGLLFIPQLGGELAALPENLLVVITKNDLRDATEALIRRCRTVYMDWPTREVETKLIQKSLSWASQRLCHVFLEAAEQLRRHPGVKKKPSPPEVLRLIADCHRLRNRGLTLLEWSRYLLAGIAPLPADRRYLEGNPMAWAAAVREELALLGEKEKAWAA
jgi:MoxR-like ATPase